MPPPLTVVLTRQPEDNLELAEALRREGARVIESPCLEIEIARPPVSELDALPPFERIHEILFSSRHGVKGFHRFLEDFSIPRERFSHARIGAVGAATAQALLDAGWRVDHCPAAALPPAAGAGEDLARIILAEPLSHPSIFLSIRGDLSRDASASILRDAGHRIVPLTVYRNVERLPNPVAAPYEIVFVASPSAARRFLEANPPPPGVTYVAIGPTTLDFLARQGLRAVESASTRPEEILRAIRSAAHEPT